MTAAYVLNRVPSKSVDLTPYKPWTGRKADSEQLRSWSLTAYGHLTSYPHKKLGPGLKSVYSCVISRCPSGKFCGKEQR